MCGVVLILFPGLPFYSSKRRPRLHSIGNKIRVDRSVVG